MPSPKTLILLSILVTLSAVASPVAADQPGTNEDPFGGFPITGTVPDGVGVVAKFGLSPFGYALPGGVPSNQSGNGTTPRRAIYIGGLWYPLSLDPATGVNSIEMPNCATVKIPAGTSRWFKLDTWKDRRVQIWLDDELEGASRPSGSAVFGAADAYMLGTAPGDGWQKNALDGSQTGNFLEGFVLEVYDPDNLKPMWAFTAPNAAILSVNTDSAGKLLNGPDNISIREATGAGIEGYGRYNPNQPSHLLWYEGRFDGWVFVRVFNQMIWDSTASVCSYRVRD